MTWGMKTIPKPPSDICRNNFLIGHLVQLAFRVEATIKSTKCYLTEGMNNGAGKELKLLK